MRDTIKTIERISYLKIFQRNVLGSSLNPMTVTSFSRFEETKGMHRVHSLVRFSHVREDIAAHGAPRWEPGHERRAFI